MTEIPALRDAVRVTAERRYGPGRWRRRGATAGGALVAVAAVALLVAVAGPLLRPSDEIEVAAPPEPSIVAIDVASAQDDPVVRNGIPTAGPGERLERAWSVPELGGAVYLVRSDAFWCMSTPIPGGDPDADRGSNCADLQRFERAGVAVVYGGAYVAFVPDGVRPPILRLPDGSERTLDPIGGLVAIADVPRGATITRFDADGREVVERITMPAREPGESPMYAAP